MADVLIVDDDPNNRLLLATLLNHSGHQALEAADGRSALELAAQKRPHLVIVDLGLPDMSGMALIKHLRQDTPSGDGIKIALYTATQLGAAAQELAELYGISAVIPKPGDPREILTIFEGLLA